MSGRPVKDGYESLHILVHRETKTKLLDLSKRMKQSVGDLLTGLLLSDSFRASKPAPISCPENSISCPQNPNIVDTKLISCPENTKNIEVSQGGESVPDTNARARKINNLILTPEENNKSTNKSTVPTPEKTNPLTMIFSDAEIEQIAAAYQQKLGHVIKDKQAFIDRINGFGKEILKRRPGENPAAAMLDLISAIRKYWRPENVKKFTAKVMFQWGFDTGSRKDKFIERWDLLSEYRQSLTAGPGAAVHTCSICGKPSERFDHAECINKQRADDAEMLRKNRAAMAAMKGKL